MKYINQLEYEHIPYITNINEPESDLAVKGTMKRAGCGICSLCMMIDNMTMDSLSIEDCIRYSYETKSNVNPGTNVRVLGPYIAGKYDLSYVKTDDVHEMMDHLRQGGYVIANIGGDQEGYTGVFSHGGHYVLVVSVKDDIVTILDPSYKEGKYEEEGRSGKVKMNGYFAYCHYDVLDKDCSSKIPRYHLFGRKQPE